MFCSRVASVALGLFLVAAASSQAAPTTQVNSDLWDVAQGTVLTANSGSGGPPIAGILGFATGPQLAQDSYFAGGRPAGFVHFIEFETVDSVTIRSFNVWGGDDRNGGAPTRRSFTGFRLYGWNGSAFALLFSAQPTIPYPVQGPIGGDGALIVQADIPGGFTTDRWRAEFIQPAAYQGTLYGPRVLEVDGFNTFLNGTQGPPPPSNVPLPAPVLLGLAGAGLGPVVRRRFGKAAV